MNRPRVSFLTIAWTCICLSASVARADGAMPGSFGPRARVTELAVSEALKPEAVFTVKNAQWYQEFFRSNAWAKAFKKSPAYQGAMMRLSPVLFWMGGQNDDSFQGRLLDYLIGKMTSNRPVTVAYFQYPGLVSPFGVRVQSIGSGELEILKRLIGLFRSAAAVEVTLPGGAKMSVQPVSIRQQRFAIAWSDQCISVSSDPGVTAVLQKECVSGGPRADAVLDVDLGRYFSAFSAFMQKGLGISTRFSMDFAWESKTAAFIPRTARVPWKGKARLLNEKVDHSFLSAVALDAPVMVSAVIPGPKAWNDSAFRAYLSGAEAIGGDPMPVTWAFLGATREESPKSLNVFLIPSKTSSQEKELKGMASLLNPVSRREVKFKRVCGKWIAVSDQAQSLEIVERACSRKIPSYGSFPGSSLEALREQSWSSAIVWDSGRFLSAAMDLGWFTESKTDPAYTGLESAKGLFSRIPRLVLVGRSGERELVLKAVE